MRKCLELARTGSEVIRSVTWALQNWTCFIVIAWMVINLSVGSRKGESTELPGDVDSNDWFNRASVTYEINHKVYVDPPEATLRSMLDSRDHAKLAPRGSKCDQWGTCHGTEPIILPYHDDDMNAARWLRDIELRWPVHGDKRATTPLFANERGEPFKDAAFAALIMAALTAVLGETRAKLLSPHSWRVWLASSLRMCDATDARIQAMGRWLNPESIKIYARMTTKEYATWVDKLMAVKRIDTARTTSLPVLDMADALEHWASEVTDTTGASSKWSDNETGRTGATSPPLKRGERLAVYWTEMDQWFTGTFKTSRIEDADGGGTQRSSCVVYDAVGLWATCSHNQLTYWHCLDDEQWKTISPEDATP